MKFTARTKDYNLIVRVRAAFGETIDQEKLERFAQANIHGFFKPKVIKKRCIEYLGIPGMPLSEYLKEGVSKQEFFLVMQQLASAGRNLWEKGFSTENLVSDICHVYINKITKEMQLIYLPVLSGQRQNNFIELVEAVVYTMISSGDDAEYLSRFIHFFRSLGSIQAGSMEKLENYIANEDQSKNPVLNREDINHEYKDPSDRQEEAGADDVTYFEAEVHGNNEIDEDNEKTMVLDEDETESTDFRVLAQEKLSCTPVLYRISTGETIHITKEMFRLGTEEAGVDYAVLNNHAVSRSHADIICREDHYFVFDLGSKNKSYINNRALPSKYEVEIYNGDILKLANEEFEFRLGEDGIYAR